MVKLGHYFSLLISSYNDLALFILRTMVFIHRISNLPYKIGKPMVFFLLEKCGFHSLAI